MKKIFYIYYVSSRATEELAGDISAALHIELEGRDSSYTGIYYKYSGDLADRLSVEPLDPEDELRNFMDPDPTLSKVHVQILKGKNAEKLKKFTLIKEALADVRGLQFRKESILEEP